MQAKIYFIIDMRVPKLLLFHEKRRQRNDTLEKQINKSLIMTQYGQSKA